MMNHRRDLIGPGKASLGALEKVSTTTDSEDPSRIWRGNLCERFCFSRSWSLAYRCEFKFNWQQQFRRRYPDEFLDIAKNRAKGEYQMDYVPAPRITEADKKNDRKSLYRALDKKLYLLIFGKPFGATSDKPVWHFPEKVYDSEPTLRKCAESALESVLGDLTHTYFVGNAPMAHMVIQPTEETPDLPSYKRFFFKCSVVAASKYNISNCEDFVWVTKDELLEIFPEQAEFFNKMIIS